MLYILNQYLYGQVNRLTSRNYCSAFPHRQFQYNPQVLSELTFKPRYFGDISTDIEHILAGEWDGSRQPAARRHHQPLHVWRMSRRERPCPRRPVRVRSSFGWRVDSNMAVKCGPQRAPSQRPLPSAFRRCRPRAASAPALDVGAGTSF